MNTTHTVKRGIVGLTTAVLMFGGLGPGHFGASRYRPGPAHLVPRG